MGKFLDYEPMHVDEINYNTCKYLINEVCCNGDSPCVADYPSPYCKCESKEDCKYFEKEVEGENNDKQSNK